MINYYLHDSLIEDVKYFDDLKRLEISIALCNWQQPNYQRADPEMLNMLLIFEEVEKLEFSVNHYVFDSNEILEVIQEDEQTTKIVFLTTNDAETLTVTAKSSSCSIAPN